MIWAKINKCQRGIGLIEGIIAITIFTGILLACMATIVTLGRHYYSALYQSQSQEVVNSIIVNVNESLRFSGGDIRGPAYCYSPDSQQNLKWDCYDLQKRSLTDTDLRGESKLTSKEPDWIYYCLGGLQYMFRPSYILVAEQKNDPATRTAEQVFLLRQNSECHKPDYDFLPPKDDTQPSLGSSNLPEAGEPFELLSVNMQVIYFYLRPVVKEENREKQILGTNEDTSFHDNKLWEVGLKIAYSGAPYKSHQQASQHSAFNSETHDDEEDEDSSQKLIFNDCWNLTTAEIHSSKVIDSTQCNRIKECKKNEFFCAVAESQSRVLRRISP